MYEGIQSEVVGTTRFYENSDLSTTYLLEQVRSRQKESFLYQNKDIQ